MKTGDIIPQKEKLGKIISYIAKKSSDEGKTVVTGKELKEKYDYEFIHDGLVVTIDRNIQQMVDREFKVDEFWGHQIRIDIAAGTEDGSLSNSELKRILKDAFEEYVDVINRKSQKYDEL